MSVNLLWLVGDTGRSGLVGLVTVALEERVLGAGGLRVEQIPNGGAWLVPLTWRHSTQFTSASALEGRNLGLWESS